MDDSDATLPMERERSMVPRDHNAVQASFCASYWLTCSHRLEWAGSSIKGGDFLSL
jgi:hypothetical protein